jgi:hypothetical protein
VTTTCTGPAFVAFGRTNVSDVSDVTVIDFAVTDPTFTLFAPVSAVPVSVTEPPPKITELDADSAVTVGRGAT